MKLLLSLVTVLFVVFSGSVFADQEYVGADQDVSASIGSSVGHQNDSHHQEADEAADQVVLRCYKSSKPNSRQRCRCSRPGYDYDVKLRRCIQVKFPQEEQVVEEDEVLEQADSMIAGCEGGSLSSDGLVITCPDGSTFHRSRNTMEDLSRSLAQQIEERYGDEDVNDTESFFSQSNGSHR